MCFSISYQRLLMKENVESVLHLWQNASLLLWGGGSVLHCARYISSTHLFPLACSSRCHRDRKKTCVSCIYLTDFIDHFFLSLILIPWRRLESTSPQENSNTKRISSVYTFSDQLLLYLIYFHFQNTLILISANLHLWWKPIILTHITLTNAGWFFFYLYFYKNCSQSLIYCLNNNRIN